MSYSEIISKVSKEINLSEDVVHKTYKAYWKTIKDIIQQLPLKDDLSEESFNKLKCNINIPSLGKLSVDWNRYLGVKKRFNYIKLNTNVEDKED